jgi:hypothetical protein
MFKKIIIAVLIALILISLGIIGYIVISQNKNIDWFKFWPLSSKEASSELKVPPSFFPNAPDTTEGLLSNNNTNKETGDQNEPVNLPDINRKNLEETKALGLTIINRGKNEQVIFLDRSSGNIFEITPQNELSRLTGDTINNIEEVYWGRDKQGDHLISRSIQFNKLITSVGLIKFSSSTELGSINNQILGLNISAIAISPDKSKFFVLEPTKDGVVGYLNDWGGKNKKKIWSFPYQDWRLAWPKDTVISLTTTPSANDLGSLYFLNPTTGALKKILSGIPGLTTKISPDGSRVLFSRSGLNSTRLYFYEVGSQKTSSVDINTLPEKCTWMSNENVYCAVPRSLPLGLYPDSWYQGKITLTDNLWKIDFKQKTTVLIETIKGSYDLTDLVVVPERGWLYAINKNDSSIQSFILPRD